LGPNAHPELHDHDRPVQERGGDPTHALGARGLSGDDRIRETATAIAERFGVSEKHVQQRLKLGNAAPELLKAYREERITLDALMAFAITDDREKQTEP
jgi:hypothetical protein